MSLIEKWNEDIVKAFVTFMNQLGYSLTKEQIKFLLKKTNSILEADLRKVIDEHIEGLEKYKNIFNENTTAARQKRAEIKQTIIEINHIKQKIFGCE